jgi:hypothetical protein
MIALDARGLAGASPLNDDTRHSAACEVHREAQTHRASPDNQHLSRESFAQIRRSPTPAASLLGCHYRAAPAPNANPPARGLGGGAIFAVTGLG